MRNAPTTDVVKVTPAQAAKWLAMSNTHNRAIRESKVALYARDMSSGAWKFNGDTVRFAADGTLLDGQHRLHAIVRSGVTVPFVVVRGLDIDAQDTMDIGAHRALRDQLLLRGEHNSGFIAAISRRALLLERGQVTSSGWSFAPSHAEMIAYIDANPDIRRASEIAVRAHGKLPAAPSAIGTAFLTCARVNESDAETFYVSQIIDGLGLFDTDPAYVLRQRLQREVMTTGRKMEPDDVYRYCILAWNHYRGRTGKITKLQAPKGGWGSAPAPQPK